MYINAAIHINGSELQMRMAPRPVTPTKAKTRRIREDATDAVTVGAKRPAPRRIADDTHAPGMMVQHTRAPIATRVLSAAQAFSQGNSFFSGQLLDASA
ncbi:hypothetical protein [Amaricoccus tamworthensis]|uniref:hypothetical protein n=1 Tax=Amaricoccus tamworthensis TaxID=57002 RepID=UPI003C7BAD3E